jgi:hypothetical protein
MSMKELNKQLWSFLVIPSTSTRVPERRERYFPNLPLNYKRMGVNDWAALHIHMPPGEWGVSLGGWSKIPGSRCMICKDKKFNILQDLDGHLGTDIHQKRSDQWNELRAAGRL